MITINDIGLVLPTPELCDWVDRHISLDRVAPLLRRAWPGPGSVFATLPTGYRPDPPPRLGVLRWPFNSASRWAQGLFVAGDTNGQVSAIHDAAFGTSGTALNAVTLKMNSPDAITGTAAETLTATMYVLALVPLARVVDDSDKGVNPLYMIHLVDRRYFWWSIPCPDFAIDEVGTKGWSDVITAINTALGVSISVTSIDSVYLKPSRSINLTNEPIPPVLDAVAYNIGRRVVVGFDGSVKMQTFSEAITAYDTDMSNNPNRIVLAGSNRFLDKI